MTTLAHQLIVAFAIVGAGCAASDDTGEKDLQQEFEDALASAEDDGEAFPVSAQVQAGDDEQPATALAVGEGQPTVAYLKRNGSHRVGSFETSGLLKSYGGSTVFYPRDDSTDLAGVVMCPGFSALKGSIAGWGPFFASHGIVLMTIDTKTTLDQVVQRAPQIQEALRDLQEMGDNRSELRGRFGGKWGVSGWSMGGGGTWLTAANQAQRLGVRTAVTLAGHNLTAGGAIGVGAANIRIPTLMMNGSTDATILGGLAQTDSAYSAIPNGTPKMMWETGTCGHFCWGDPNAGNNISGVLMMAWQKTFLEGDDRFRSLLNCQTARGDLLSLTTSCRTDDI